MEKRLPHCPLPIVKTLIEDGKVCATVTAIQCARRLGFDSESMIAEVLKLKRDEFYKSMTTYADHKVWQDVYLHKSPLGMLYIKLTVIENVLIVSFKEM